jgi:hypothetical protein
MPHNSIPLPQNQWLTELLREEVRSLQAEGGPDKLAFVEELLSGCPNDE